MNTLPIEYLRECFNVCFEKGVLTWRKRPLAHFKNQRGHSIWNSRFPGTEALATSNAIGYKFGVINGRKFKAHRVIYALHRCKWPSDEIDHINGIRDDNRIINLRAVTHQENSKNQRKPVNNTSGVNGVSWCKSHRKWRANIRAEGKQKHLGWYNTLLEAATARKRAEQKHGFHENHGRD